MQAEAPPPKADEAQGLGRASRALAKFTKFCQPAQRWQIRLISAAAGALSTLAMAPFHFWPVLWLTLPALLLLADTSSNNTTARPSRVAPWQRTVTGRMAETGWWFGFGYHLVGLHWIVEPFLVEAEIFAWLIPVAVTLMPAGLALFTAAAVGLPHLLFSGLLGHGRARLRLYGLAVGFGITEWLRGHILTGFPWNVLGYALTWPLEMMQSAALFGIYGLTMITVLIFAAPYVLIVEPHKTAHRPAMAGLAALAALFAFGAWRLATHPITPPAADAPTIRIVQPSIPQRERLQPENRRSNFDQHLLLSRTRPDGVIDDARGISVIVWPEAAMPFVVLAQPVALTEIGALLGNGATLVTGALRAESLPQPNRFAVFNSLLAFTAPTSANGHATLAAVYDKIHLVPFGEYLPLARWLEVIGLETLTRQVGGFARGAVPRKLLTIPKIGPVLPLICYEAIFPSQLNKELGRPALQLLITNDGWFGTTTGPRQHYHQGRVRAVETAVPLLRASSNGISGMIDALGREQGRLQLNTVGTADIVPTATLIPPFYAIWGDLIATALLILLCIAILGAAPRPIM